MTENRSHFRFDIGQIFCKNGCGYYGNNDWNGFCSKCYREAQQKNLNSDKEEDRGSTSRRRWLKKFRESPDKYSSFNNFLRLRAFEESPNFNGVPDKEIERNILRYLMKVKFNNISSVPPDFYRSVQLFVNSLIQMTSKLNEEYTSTMLADKVQDFYASLHRKINFRSSYKAVNESSKILMDAAEDCIFRIMYGSIFSVVFGECEQNDLRIQRRFNELYWVTSSMICTAIKPSGYQIDAAMQALIEMDSKITPKEKLQCIVESSELILDMLNDTRKSATSADDFLPALIYVVMKAKPPRLKSNMLFISRFSEPQRLLSGKHGYLFTTLGCALHYIENLRAEQLGLTEKEFNCYMLPANSHDATIPAFFDSLCKSSDAILLLEQHKNNFRQIIKRTNRFKENALRLKNRMNDFYFWVAHEVPTLIGTIVDVEEIPDRSTIEDLKNKKSHMPEKNVVNSLNKHGFSGNSYARAMNGGDLNEHNHKSYQSHVTDELSNEDDANSVDLIDFTSFSRSFHVNDDFKKGNELLYDNVLFKNHLPSESPFGDNDLCAFEYPSVNFEYLASSSDVSCSEKDSFYCSSDFKNSPLYSHRRNTVVDTESLLGLNFVCDIVTVLHDVLDSI